jgi:hypothetical protein
MTLYSLQQPHLPAENYDIKVAHKFTIPLPDGSTITRTLEASRKLDVRAPQFSLDRSAIHSVYPPPGAEISCQVLPHVVLHDSNLPWARPIVSADGSPMPWLCLMAFDPADLILSDGELYATSSNPTTGLFPPGTDKTAQQFSTTAYSLETTIQTLTTANPTLQTPFGDTGISTKGQDPNSQVSVILPRRSLFAQLFPWTNPSSQFYRYLAHARELDASNFADILGVTDGDENGQSAYGVLTSPRCGPIGLAQPQTVIVHVVSVESVAGIYGAASEISERVALISLYSWTYSCTPPNSVDFLDSMQHLGNNLQRLRASDQIIERLIAPIGADTKNAELPADASQKAWLAARLDEGFTFVRHRLANGDVTTGMLRSVLTPNLVPHPLREAEEGNFPSGSSYGTDLQIVDRKTGLADLTYNLAWELGKSLGTADKAFSSALVRVRNAIHNIATRTASQTVLAKKRAFMSRKSLLRGLDGITDSLKPSTQPIDSETHPRWACGSDKFGVAAARASLSFSSPAMAAALPQSILGAAEQVASAVDGSVYDEVSAPTNTDWAIVLAWVLDKMFLKDIPPQYILPDPSHLPRETLRTFHVDDNWIDCLIDGALSIVNRFDKHDGGIRDAIKQQVNRYLQTQDKNGEYPPVPSWGFLMRSGVVSAFPNLEIKAARPGGKAEALGDKDVCVLSVISSDILLCVFNRGLSKDTAREGFVISQPKHQQSYGFPDLEQTHVQLTFTAPPDPDSNALPPDSDAVPPPSLTGRWERDGPVKIPHNTDAPVQPGDSTPWAEKVFDFDTRMLQIPGLVSTATKVYENLFSAGRRPTLSGQVTGALVSDLLSQPTLQMTLQDPEIASDIRELPYRKILTRDRVLPATDPDGAFLTAEGARSKRQLPLKQAAPAVVALPEGTQMSVEVAVSATTTSSAYIPSFRADSGVSEEGGSALLHTSAAVAVPQNTALAAFATTIPTEVPALRSELFGPDFQFPRSFLRVEADNPSLRTPKAFSTNRMLFVPFPVGSTSRAALLINTVAPLPGPLALNRLQLRIPIGPYVDGDGFTLFDHTRPGLETAPQPRVVGPRWLCHAAYEPRAPATGDAGGGGQGQGQENGQKAWYVITVVPRVGVDPLFGWRLSEMASQGLQLLLPDLDFRSRANPPLPIRWHGVLGRFWMPEEVRGMMRQECTWEERVTWEKVGWREDEFVVTKAVEFSRGFPR